MPKQTLIKSYLKQHQKENTALLFWSSNLVEYCKGRIVKFDDHHVLIRDHDEETERPYELLLRLENIAAIYPSLEQKEEDERFRKIMGNYNGDKKKSFRNFKA